ncbi:MAG: hypothetical protein M3Z10_05295 [Gemmatimonadota bacterium]|nr:hypothetical protein [Gemmatimonadota bacterium]
MAKMAKGKVVIDVSMSLDGFIAGPDDTPEEPLSKGGDRLPAWFGDGDTPQSLVSLIQDGGGQREALRQVRGPLWRGGVRSPHVRRSGRLGWGWAQPGIPLFVLTNRAPITSPGGDPPYTFVTDGLVRRRQGACCRVREARVADGSTIAQQRLQGGSLDEITIHLDLVLLGGGVRLFEGPAPRDAEVSTIRVVDAPGVTHVTYRVVR